MTVALRSFYGPSDDLSTVALSSSAHADLGESLGR